MRGAPVRGEWFESSRGDCADSAVALQTINANDSTERAFVFRMEAYAACAREIVFDDDLTLEACVQLLSRISILTSPHLSRISITHSAAHILFKSEFFPSEAKPQGENEAYVKRTFRNLAPHFRDIALVNLPAIEAAMVLDQFPSLKLVRCPAMDTVDEETSCLGGQLAEMELNMLELSTTSGEASCVDWLEQE